MDYVKDVNSIHIAINHRESERREFPYGDLMIDGKAVYTGYVTELQTKADIAKRFGFYVV